jgi:predicted exporter
MVLVWLCTMFLVPPLVLLGERLRPGVFTPKANLWRYPFAVLGGMVQRRPLVFALLCMIALLGAVRPLARYVKDPLEWNFNNLRSDETEAQKQWEKMYEMGMGSVGAGYIGNTGVLVVDSPEQAEPVAEAMRKKDAALGPTRHVLAAVRTINSVLPTQQEQKLELLTRIRAKIDRHREMMSDGEWHDIEGFRPPEYLRKLTPDDLPRLVRDAFTETDDTRGRLIGMDADYNNYQDWNGHDLMRLAEALRVDALGKTWVAASAGTVFGGMIETIHRDGPQVTKVALLGVVGLLVLMFGVRGSLPVLLSLALGMAWMGGMLGYLQVKLNFMNFVTIPITLGIGAEYAANIWARLRHEGPGAIGEVIANTGSAVALCSTTTMIGYSTLLLASNRALRSFGLAADIGEITCLIAALLFLPVLVRTFWLSRKPRSKSEHGRGTP